MKSIIKRTAAGFAAAALAVTAAVSGSIFAVADGVEVKNALFETDIWGDGGAWAVSVDWDTGATVSYISYADKSADAPSTGSANGVNVWFPSDCDGGEAVLTQTVSVPAGEYAIKAQGMGENCDLRVSMGDCESGNVGMNGWNVWNEASTEFSCLSAGNVEIRIIADCKPGGWIYLDGVTVDVISLYSDSSSNSSGDTSSSSVPDDSESEYEDNSSSVPDSSSDTTSSKPTNTTQNNTIYNGNFEKVSETDLVGWTVDWKDELKCWYATDEQKKGRADLANNYLNVWAEKAVPFSLKQTVHFTPGDYKIAYSLDANENFDTGVKVRVGSLVTTAFPKGEGWEKWKKCASDKFTITEEGDYEVEFFGDLAADAWFALDIIEVRDGGYDPASGSGSTSSSSSSGSSTAKSTTSTAAGGGSTSSAAADSTANTETGAANTAAQAFLLASAAAAVIVVNKKRKD